MKYTNKIDNKKACIMQVIPNLHEGGAERTTRDIAKELVQQGYQSIVVCNKGQQIQIVENEGSKVIRLPVHSKSPLTIITNIFRIAALIKKYQVDIVHVRSRACAWSCFFACKRTQTPFITTFHSIYSGTSKIKKLYNSVMTRSDYIIANSDYTLRHIRANYQVDNKKICRIYRGIDTDQFSKPTDKDKIKINQLKSTWKLNSNKKTLILLGRAGHHKGHFLALKALSEYSKIYGKKETPILIFAGSLKNNKKLLSQIKKTIQKYDLISLVKIVGGIPLDEVQYALCAANIVLVPSTKPEAFGRVAAEAQSCGCPVIASKLGATSETIIEHNKNNLNSYTGIVLPIDSPPQWAKSIHKILTSSQQKIDEISKRANNHIKNNFSKTQMITSTINLYKKVLLNNHKTHLDKGIKINHYNNKNPYKNNKLKEIL